jgi:hypothetical protein
MSGAAAETRSRMGRSADVPEPADRGRVAARRGQWPPQKVLVQLGGATLRIAADGVGIAAAQVVRRQDIDRADFVAQIGGVPRDPVQHAIGISLGQRLGPAVRRIEFPGRIATGRIPARCYRGPLDLLRKPP